MKKMFICFCVAAALYACGGSSDNYADSSASSEKKADATEDPAFVAGRDLVGKSDCFTCHKIDDASTGPAYRKVAEKYANTPENQALLAEKIIKGGSGVWGSVPMLAHPAISTEDATAMAKYILLLKK
jgi:cytochrome c